MSDPLSNAISGLFNPEQAGFDSAIEALEWRRFLELAAHEAASHPAKAWIRSMDRVEHWASTVESAQALQLESLEMQGLLQRSALWGVLKDLMDPIGMLESLDRGLLLDLEALVAIRSWLYAIDSWVQLPKDDTLGKLFKKVLGNLHEPREPLRIFHRVLTHSGEISEKASPKYGALLKEHRALKLQISSKLDELMKRYSTEGVLQDKITDVRDGRFVLPVKISMQGKVEGTIADTSMSRQTAFIEPRELEPLNQRLRALQNEISVEAYRILEETARQLRPFAGEIQSSVLILIHWDVAQARARLARTYGGKAIQVVAERQLLLRDTANPLLWWAMEEDRIVRNDISIGDETRTLLITGPNTGGKTVLLKTLGLAALCARTGFPFPASGQPIVPFFDSVQMDVGDAQSIERHLSSFSGHVLQFKRILESLTDRSLILLDELNAATDPQEGAALARAFLETAMKRDPMMVSTTHDPSLKALAMTDTRIQSASMEFNEQTHEPTYRLVFGVPGRSRALDIAEKLGLPPDLIALARAYLSEEHLRFESLIARLETETHAAERLRREAQSLRDEAERMKAEWTERTEKTVGELLEKTRVRLRAILEQAQDDVRLNLKRIEESRSHKDLEKHRQEIQASVSSATQRMESALAEEAPDIARALESEKKPKTEPQSVSIAGLSVGDPVRVPKFKTLGVVLEVLQEKGELRYRVALGNPVQAQGSKLQMTLKPAEVQALSAGELRSLWAQMPPHLRKQGTGTGVVASAGMDDEPVSSVPSQLDLRGARFEAAMADLERYLDRAYRSGRAEVRIIHGVGTGALREGTLELLRGLPYVKAFRDGGSGGGGTGATVVEFDR